MSKLKGSDSQISPDLITRTLAVLREAIRDRPAAVVFLVVLAVAMVGAAIRFLYVGDAGAAILFLAIPIAAAHLINPLVPPKEEEPRREFRILTSVMAWGFSVILLLSASATAVSGVGCSFGYFCGAISQSTKSPTVSFSMLNEKRIDTTAADAFVLKAAEVVQRNTIHVAADTQPLAAFVTTFEGFALGPDGKIHAQVDFWTGPDSAHLSREDSVTIDDQAAWRSGNSMVTRYPGGVVKFERDLRQQGIAIGKNTAVLVTTCTCIPREVLDSKTPTFITLVTDLTTGAMARREVQVQFIQDQNLSAPSDRQTGIEPPSTGAGVMSPLTAKAAGRT